MSGGTMKGCHVDDFFMSSARLFQIITAIFQDYRGALNGIAWCLEQNTVVKNAYLPLILHNYSDKSACFLYKNAKFLPDERF